MLNHLDSKSNIMLARLSIKFLILQLVSVQAVGYGTLLEILV